MKKFINPDSFGKEPTKYSHGVLTSFSKILLTAGQVAMDDQQNVIGKGDIKIQTQYIMENLKIILVESEMNFNNVVKVNMYLTNIDDLDKVIVIRNRYLQPNKPSCTAVEVSSLANPDLLIEIEVIAVE